MTFYAVPGANSKTSKSKILAASDEKSSGECVPPKLEPRRASSLDIISELRDALPEAVSLLRPGFGGTPKPTKFGNNARRKLLRAGASLGSLPGGDTRCLFLTGTLPGSTREAADAIARYSSYIVDRLKTWLFDNGGSSYNMYVWERQKRGALHLHYVVYIDPSEKGNKIFHGFKQYWYKLLCRVCTQSGVDLFARSKGGTWRNCPKVVQAKAVWCTRSVAAYLSKYLGKRVNAGGREGGVPPTYPVRWWGVSRPLNALLQSQTFERIYYSMRRRDAQNFYVDISSWLENTSDKCYAYTHKYTGSRVTVAYNNLWSGEQLWEAMRTPLMKELHSNSNSNDLELTTTKLRSLMKRHFLTSQVLSQLLGSYCGEVAEKLHHSKQLSLADAIEVSNGFHFYLTWKYRDRLKRPPSLKEDVSFLENSLSWMLEESRRLRNQA